MHKYLITNQVRVCKKAVKRVLAYLALITASVFRSKSPHASLISPEQARDTLYRVYCPAPISPENRIPTSSSQEVCLSIIIPVYNGEAYLRACMDSILSQPCDFSFELICVDDGSSDSSPDILKTYSRDSRVKVITQNNQGISGARNRGLQEAIGQYIMFVDNDDVLSPTFLNTMLGNACATKADIVKCGYQILRNGQLERKCIEHASGVFRDSGLSNIFRFNGYCWGTLFHRELFRDLCFPSGYWYEDMITRMMLYPRCKTFSYIGEALYLYRIHTNNSSGTVWNNARVKALDQLYLTEHAYHHSVAAGIPFTPGFCLAIQYELGIMLYHRTLSLDVSVRESAFVVACDLYGKLLEQCPNFALSGMLSERMLNDAFVGRDFHKWNYICKHATCLY